MIHIILFQPEIAQNVGNIARTCVAFNCKLHLIRPYGFIFDINKLKRSSANHWSELDYCEYDDYNEFMIRNNHPNIFIYTRYGNHKPNDINYQKYDDIFLMFGRESCGVDLEIIKQHKDSLIRIPMSEKMRSLNLANTISIATYEVIKQLNYPSLCEVEPHKKINLD